MTIIYIHGVKVRDPAHGRALEKPFRRWLAPAIAANGREPDYCPVYWGDAAATFRWSLTARPRTAILRQGAPTSYPGLGSLREAATAFPLDGSVGAPTVSAVGPVLGQIIAPSTSSPPLSSVPRGERPDLLADLFLAVRPRNGACDPIAENPVLAPVADAAASVAKDWDRIISSESSEEERAAKLMQAMEQELTGEDLLSQGAFQDWMSKAGETLNRAALWPANAISTVLAELRPELNELVAYFIGDVLTYIERRGAAASAPGPIPQRVLVALKNAHRRKTTTQEPIIVVTHSMGGQLFYDAVTFFAEADRELNDLKVDHWVSCGAQVSFFAELGLFKGQPSTLPNEKLKRPARVKAWTNYFDRNDLLGFVMDPVFEGVNDIPYDTGYGLGFAHSGFLARPSFFEDMATRLLGPPI